MSATSRRWLVPALALLALIVAVRVADAHDFWLVPDAFQVAEGGSLDVRGQTSSRFPTSESAVAPDRIIEARVLGATPAADVRITDISTSGSSLLLRHRPRGVGQRVVTASIGWRSARAPGAGLKRYIELEGNPALAARYESEGLLPTADSITRRYAKYAKTIVEVGRGGPRAFARSGAHPLEFMPLDDPGALRAGDTAKFRLLYNGEPLPEFQVHAGVALDAREPHDVGVVTDAGGVLRIPLGHAGLWNVRTIHVVPAPRGSGADWESHFATLVFRVGGTQGVSDSTEVLRIVSAYSDALAKGDSLGALALLAPDAVVLESGGIETLAEYRQHHLPADIAYAAGVPSQRTVQRVTVRGDVAWVATTSVSQGEFRGRAVNSAGAELMVLTRTTNGWKISAIHWSSRARRQQ